MANGIKLTLATRTALVMFDESMRQLVHMYRAESTETKWTCKLWQVCQEAAHTCRIDEPVRLCLAQFLKKAGVMQDRGRFNHIQETAPREIGEQSADFGMFIQLAHVLTGEELAADYWGLCVDVQRLWWVLQLLCKAERIGANPKGWLQTRLETAIKVSQEKGDKQLAVLLNTETDHTGGRVEELKLDASHCSQVGDAASADWIDMLKQPNRPNVEEGLIFSKHGICKDAVNRQSSPTLQGFLNGAVLLNIDLQGGRFEACTPARLALFSTPKNGSCWAISFMRTLGALLGPGAGMLSLREVVRKETFDEVLVWARQGVLLQTEKKDLLDCSVLRQHLCKLLHDRKDSVKHLFTAGPSHNEADMEAAMALARSLGFDVNIESGDHVKAWAIAVLDPSTYFTESLCLSFLILALHGEIGVVTITKVLCGSGKARFQQSSCQPLIHQNALALIYMVHEQRVPAAAKGDMDTVLDDLAAAAWEEENCGRKVTRQSLRSVGTPTQDQLRQTRERVQTKVWAGVDDQGHFTEAHFLDEDGQSSWTFVRPGHMDGGGSQPVMALGDEDLSAAYQDSQGRQHNKDMESSAADSCLLPARLVNGSPTESEAEILLDDASRESQDLFFRQKDPLQQQLERAADTARHNLDTQAGNPEEKMPTLVTDTSVASSAKSLEHQHNEDSASSARDNAEDPAAVSPPVPSPSAVASKPSSSQSVVVPRHSPLLSPRQHKFASASQVRKGTEIDSPGQRKLTSFFGVQPAGCKSGEQAGMTKKKDDDNDDAADSQPPGAGTGTGPARQETCSGAEQGGASGAGGAGGAAGSTQLAITQLATVAHLLKEAPHSHGLEASVERSVPGLKNRRQLFTALYRADKSISNLSEADRTAAITKIMDPIIRRFVCYIIASQVLEEERSLGPRLRQFGREKLLPGLLEVGCTEVMLSPIHEALRLTAACLSSQASQQLRDVPQAMSACSVRISDSQMHAECEDMPQLPGVPGMLQRLLETCCLCGSAPDNHCHHGHLRACCACIRSLGLKQLKQSGGQCMCLAIAVSLQPKLREVCRLGGKAVTPKRQALIFNSSYLDKAATLLILAATLDVKPVIDTLLQDVVHVVTGQLQVGLLPSLTAEQIVVLHGIHHDVTEHLVKRVAKAHADALREHISYAPGAPQLNVGVQSSPHLGLRVGYLVGPLDNAELAHGALANTKEEEDIWLIICAGRSRTPLADVLVDLYSKKHRLLELKGGAAQQAAEVHTLNLDILVLMTFPSGDLEHILASGVARKTVNWRGMSASRTDLCDFTLVGSSSACADPDPRVIRVGFDQPVQATRLGSAKQRPNREALGLPASGFVVTFPGLLVQVDKFSLWTWMQLVAGLDGSVLALTAEQASMKVIVEQWVKEYAELHGPFASDRVLLLEWQGSEIHAARIGHSSLCVATLNPKMSLIYLAASVLAEAVGFLVLEGTGSADVRACGLGALLIAQNAEEFVSKGQMWASQRQNACAFLREQREKYAGCFNPDRYSTMLNKVFRAVLEGETAIPFDEPVPDYEDDQKTRWAGIFATIGESRLSRVLFYKQGFERILDFLERSGIKVQGVAGMGGSAYVVRAVLSRDYRRVKKVVVKIDRTFRRITTMHNSGVLRDAAIGRTISNRMRGSMWWSDLVPKPVYMLHGGRSFVGHTEPNSSNHVILFSIFEDVECRFEDTLASFTTEWLEDATVSNDLVLACQEIFLALWHAHSNGLVVGDIKAQNIGQNPHGKAVFWDLGHGMCGPPKAGDAYGKTSGPSRLMRRTSTHHFAAAEKGDGTNPQGDANLFRASGQGNRKLRKVPFLFFTARDLDRGEQLSQQRNRGLGRLGNGTFTNYDCKAAEERAEAVKKDPDASHDREREEDEDIFQALRTILQVFKPVDWKNPVDWECRATAAAADPAQMLEFLKSGTRRTPQQPLALERFANWFAIGLGPRPRPKLIDLMTHLALTTPALPPAVEQAIVRGEGFAFAGGTVGQVYPAIKEEWQDFSIPPTLLRQESDGKETGEDIGLGLQAVTGISEGAFVGFYCGTKRAQSQGPMDTFPSRYGVSSRSQKQRDKITIDGFVGRKLTLQWLKDHQATGAFMNAGDWQGGPRSNVRLDGHKAWTDPATDIVWIPMYAICDIAAGDFLRWKYSPEDGEAGIYTFK
jgi:hypothetical protein